MANVLIIDDDKNMCSMLSKLVCRLGHEATFRNMLDEGLSAAQATPFDVVLLDVRMPDGNGLEILPELRRTESAPEVVIMTGFGTADGAEIAIENGAWDYIQKKDSTSKIKLLLQRVLQYRESLKNVHPTARALKLEGIVGNSAIMMECYDRVAQAASTSANVLLTGETGTGKELFAMAIHNNSARAGGNFVVVDCSALPENLVESVLFGHEKGAFTGATQAREGLIAQAHKGTLFLDEIGELPLAIQKKFLRVSQERRYRPLGGKNEIESDFRLVAATNRNLEEMVRNGSFREDLFFRIRTLSLTLPPLRYRQDDIKALANHYVLKICDRNGTGVKGMSPDFLEMLTQYSWPGNVRELINALETAVSASTGKDILYSMHIPNYIRIQVLKASLPVRSDGDYEKMASALEGNALPSFKNHRKTAIDRADKEYLEKLSTLTNNDAQAACKISGLSKSRYYELIKQYNINVS